MKAARSFRPNHWLLGLILSICPFSARAQTLDGQFDWSGTYSAFFFSYNLSGTATFTYDTSTNQGTILGLPSGFEGENNDGSYPFSTYINPGIFYPLAVSSFDEFVAYDNIFVNGAPASTYWIIYPVDLGAVGPAAADMPPASPDLSQSGGYLNSGNLVLQEGASQPTSSDDPPPLFIGTYTDLVQSVPEPSSLVLLAIAWAGAYLVFRFRCPERHPKVKAQ